MIRTRPSTEEELGIAGDGDFILALTYEELQLIAALVGLCKLGVGRPYRMAAYNILTHIEELTDDPDFSVESIVDIAPVFTVHEPVTLDQIAQYDDSYLIEIDV